MQSFCSHCFASIIGVLPATPPNSTRSSNLYLSDTRLTCQTTWHPNARHEPQPPRRAPPELLKLMFTYGAHSCLFHDKRLLRCKTASMKREEGGRGGGGVYANGLQDKKNTTDWFQARSRPGDTSAGLRRIERRELDETFFFVAVYSSMVWFYVCFALTVRLRKKCTRSPVQVGRSKGMRWQQVCVPKLWINLNKVFQVIFFTTLDLTLVWCLMLQNKSLQKKRIFGRQLDIYGLLAFCRPVPIFRWGVQVLWLACRKPQRGTGEASVPFIS